MTTTRPFWMVYAVGVGPPTIRHETLAEAVAEAKRLARQNPEREFAVLEAISIVVKRDVLVRSLAPRPTLPAGDAPVRHAGPPDDDDIPF